MQRGRIAVGARRSETSCPVQPWSPSTPWHCHCGWGVDQAAAMGALVLKTMRAYCTENRARIGWFRVRLIPRCPASRWCLHPAVASSSSHAAGRPSRPRPRPPPLPPSPSPQVLGNAKGVVAVIISLLYFRNPVNVATVCGYCMTVTGVVLYSQVGVGGKGCGGTGRMHGQVGRWAAWGRGVGAGGRLRAAGPCFLTARLHLCGRPAAVQARHQEAAAVPEDADLRQAGHGQRGVIGVASCSGTRCEGAVGGGARQHWSRQQRQRWSRQHKQEKNSGLVCSAPAVPAAALLQSSIARWRRERASAARPRCARCASDSLGPARRSGASWHLTVCACSVHPHALPFWRSIRWP